MLYRSGSRTAPARIHTLIEIRTYEGDAVELSRFTRDVWCQSYQGRMLIPLWEPEYLEWQLLGEKTSSRDFMVAAYDGTKLVGTDLANAFRFRVRNRELDCTLRSWFTVHPDYRHRGTALMLIHEQRRRHLDWGVPLSLGFLYRGWSGSLGPKFFSRRSDHVLIRKFGFWARLLDHRAVARGDLSRLKAFGALALGMIQKRLRPLQDMDGIRPYRMEDLPACLELAIGLLKNIELGCVWTAPHLAHQLQYRDVPRTLIIENHGCTAGFINYHRLDALGRDRIEIAMIDIAALDGLDERDSERLLQAALCHMAEEGIKIALMMRLSPNLWRPLLASGFVPLPHDMYVVARSFEQGLYMEGLKRICMPCR
jgi:GNAT superfamily N-acetyltransferase